MDHYQSWILGAGNTGKITGITRGKITAGNLPRQSYLSFGISDEAETMRTHRSERSSSSTRPLAASFSNRVAACYSTRMHFRCLSGNGKSFGHSGGGPTVSWPTPPRTQAGHTCAEHSEAKSKYQMSVVIWTTLRPRTSDLNKAQVLSRSSLNLTKGHPLRARNGHALWRESHRYVRKRTLTSSCLATSQRLINSRARG